MNEYEKACKLIADEIQEITETYREQDAKGFVDTPGGLEHMGDVWKLLHKWDKKLTAARSTPPI